MPDKDDAPTRSVLLPLGVADPTGKIGFVPNDKDGLDALDLETGKVLWQTKASTKPLLAFDQRLAVWTPIKDKPHALRLLVLDTTAKGKTLVTSEPIDLPEWASVEHIHGHSFAASVHLEKGAVVVRWEAHAWYAGGAPPSEEILKASMKDASGTVRVLLDSGKVEAIKPVAEAKLPEGVAKARENAKAYVRVNEWITTPLTVGDRLSVLVGEKAGDKEKVSLKIFDASSGKERETVELLQGKALWPQVSHDGRHLFIRQDVPKKTLDKGEDSWWVYEVDTGKWVGKVPHLEASSFGVVGSRAFFLETHPSKDQRDPWTEPRVLTAVDLKTGEVLWKHTVEPHRTLPDRP